MQTRLRLFLEWGISFGDPYLLPERAARTVAYANKQELEQAISLSRRKQQTEDDTSPAPLVQSDAPPTGDKRSYVQGRRFKQDPPASANVRTDMEDK